MTDGEELFAGRKETAVHMPMKVSTQKALTVILAILSFPFFTAGMINGKEALRMEKSADPEAFLAPAVLAEIPADYPYEAIKAQAVLVRSRCCALIEDGVKTEAVIEKLVQEGNSADSTSGHEEMLCEQAVRETEDVVLVYGGKTVNGPFFRVGNGKTRSGKDIFQNDMAPWLVSVESPWDIDSEEYLSSVSYSPDELAEKLEQQEENLSEKIFGNDYRERIDGGTLSAEEAAGYFQDMVTDDAGYVTEVKAGDADLAGESLREMLDLPSSCFSVQAVDGKVRFLCKGLGHGAGLSQAGAAAMAEEGKSAEEILCYYFPQTDLQAVGVESGNRSAG